MKVLFAVSNENISESIVKKYQKEYKEIISYKNVYYFNAIIKEIQRDKSYDRIVISEDLEPFANNDYDAIDKFIFEKLDSISDEAIDITGGDTPIILICSDRRSKAEPLLVKLFGIGIYSALLGQDRSIEEVCKLIYKPRTKKEAKSYYKIESDEVGYQSESEGNVSEVEIQNILAHYKKLGKNTDAYVESFNNIASQYSDSQLKIIVKFLPLNVRAVLEEQSPKYQSLMMFTGENHSAIKKQQERKEESLKIDFIENQANKPKLTKPIVVPSSVDVGKVKKLSKQPSHNINLQEVEQKELSKNEEVRKKVKEETEEVVPSAPKKRGRPKKVVEEVQEEKAEEAPKKRRGRPKKVEEPVEVEEETINLFDLAETEEEETILPGFEPEPQKDVFSPVPESQRITNTNSYNDPNNSSQNRINEIMNKQNNYQNFSIENLLSRDKKVVAFVGTTKNGTSFLVNNLAALLSNMGIRTAILDRTKNRNSYYIYTKNEEQLRQVAYDCMGNLENGMAQGIEVNKNLDVYTSLPTEKTEQNDEAILSTLIKSYSLVLIDCDFTTPLQYFENAQEIYLVQSMDILTIQPLTAFLRDLKAKNILEPNKLKIVINKESKIRSLTPKVVIGGMSFYNDPSMSFMTELFNKDKIKYVIIPFDIQVYNKYLESLVNCKITLNGYPKKMIQSLKSLGNMVYPLLNGKYKPLGNNTNGYSEGINE